MIYLYYGILCSMLKELGKSLCADERLFKSYKVLKIANDRYPCDSICDLKHTELFLYMYLHVFVLCVTKMQNSMFTVLTSEKGVSVEEA